MKKIFALIALSLIANVVLGQNLITHREYYDIWQTRLKREYQTLPDNTFHGLEKTYNPEGILGSITVWDNDNATNLKILFQDGSIQYEENYGKNSYGKAIRKGVMNGYKFSNGKRYLYVTAIAEDNDDNYLSFVLYNANGGIVRSYKKDSNIETIREYGQNGKETSVLMVKDGIISLKSALGEIKDNKIASFKGTIGDFKTKVTDLGDNRIQIIETKANFNLRASRYDTLYSEGIFIVKPLSEKFKLTVSSDILLVNTKTVKIPNDAYISVRYGAAKDYVGKNYPALFDKFISSTIGMDGKYIKKINNMILKEGEMSNGSVIWYKNYNDNGKLVTQSENGVETMFDPIAGTILKTRTLQNNIYITNEYYDTGEKQWEYQEEFKENSFIGDQTTYFAKTEFYKNGKIKSEYMFVDSLIMRDMTYSATCIEHKTYDDIGTLKSVIYEDYAKAIRPKLTTPPGDRASSSLVKSIRYGDNSRIETEFYYNGILDGQKYSWLRIMMIFREDKLESTMYFSNNKSLEKLVTINNITEH